MTKDTLSTEFELYSQHKIASWDLTKLTNNKVKDYSGNGHDLFFHNSLHSVKGNEILNPPLLDGESQWFTTADPVIHTNESFTVTAWVCLTLDSLNKDISFKKENVNAITAVSQESERVSAFHLGARSHNDGKVKTVPKWYFTVSPEKGEDNPDGCRDASSNSYLKESMLGKWIFLAGICDYESWSISLYVPQLNEITTTPLPKSWTPWHANKRIVIGRGKWESEEVDKWPGYIKHVECFSKALDKQEILSLYNNYSSSFTKNVLY